MSQSDSSDTGAQPATTSEATAKVLWVGERPVAADRAKDMLRSVATVTPLGPGHDLGASLRLETFGLVIVDAAARPGPALDAARLVVEVAPKARLLVVTAPDDLTTAESAVDLGAHDFLPEPLDWNLLAPRVRLHLEAAPGGSPGPSEHRDDVTGLPGRAALYSRLVREFAADDATERSFAIASIDLDGFSLLNEAVGREAGDGLLRRAAEVLERQLLCADPGDGSGPLRDALLARTGSDEFVAVLPQVSGPERAAAVARRAIEALGQPLLVAGREVRLQASVGVAAAPLHATDAEGLLTRADAALAAAKRAGGEVRVFEQRMAGAQARKSAIEEQLRHAIDRGELDVHYQPRVDLRTGRVQGFEALVRWNNASLGPIQPKEFVPIAEETLQVLPIGEWVMEQACRAVKTWRTSGWPEMSVSVNVSSQQFKHADVARTVTDVLRRADLPPEALELEITESMVMADGDNDTLALRDLKAIGVRVALDDFGTGFSSLSVVTKFPLDVLKMDRSIVSEVDADPGAASVAQAVVAMGHSLGLSIVAEGVDARSQVDWLQEIGCDEVQGFLVSAAMPRAEVAGFLERFERQTERGDSPLGPVEKDEMD